MIFMGLLMFTGKMNAITGYLSGTAGTQTSSKETTKKEIKEEKQDTYPATDFVLQDQYGKEHSLADYKGKTIFLNFWATWCPPCKAEMPDGISAYPTTFMVDKDGNLFGYVQGQLNEDMMRSIIRQTMEGKRE